MTDKEKLQKDLAEAWKSYTESGAATVDALEENTQELAFAKGFKAGYKITQQKELEIVRDSLQNQLRIEKACAEYQKQQMIDKACIWLYAKLNEGIVDYSEFIRDFKKAIKEQ